MSLKKILKKNKTIYYLLKRLLLKINYLEVKYFYHTSLKLRFRKRLQYNLDLKNPQTFCEKLQWLKLNYHNPKMVHYTDKYEVRKHIKKKIGDDILIEIYGVYNNVEEINLDDLPDQFVLKPNHSSGRVIICKDKSKMNWKKEFKKMRRWLKENFYYETGEWQYKEIKPKIICEKLLQEDITDYKIFCFNGVPKFTQIINNRDGSEYQSSFYDIEWNKMSVTRSGHKVPKYEIPEPINYGRMLEISRIISKDFPFVRMDFYEVDGKLYFGETTFSPGNGMIKFEPQSYDLLFGSYIKLPRTD